MTLCYTVGTLTAQHCDTYRWRLTLLTHRHVSMGGVTRRNGRDNSNSNSSSSASSNSASSNSSSSRTATEVTQARSGLLAAAAMVVAALSTSSSSREGAARSPGHKQ
jgi:hypothetical protein